MEMTFISSPEPKAQVS